jgi:hypothetical protein
MPSLQESLHRFLAVDGVRMAALIDIATGMIVQLVGKAGPDLAVTASCLADEARVARMALGPGLPAGDVDGITTVTTTRLHVARILRSHPSEGLLLVVDVERSSTNVALASLRVDQLTPAVLA